jgi:hypothetical protein
MPAFLANIQAKESVKQTFSIYDLSLRISFLQNSVVLLGSWPEFVLIFSLFPLVT